MKIAITADPEIPIPPKLYGGIERIIDMITRHYLENGHQVSLFAHPKSVSQAKLYAYSVKTGNNKIDFLKNMLLINKTLIREKHDIIHSFGRLGYLLPQLPLSIPKLMSYQRRPTISQIKKAVKIAKKNTLAFTGCSNYITQQISPFAASHTIYNGVDLSHYNFTNTVEHDAPLVFLGRIEPIKGTHIAIEIAQKSNKRLIIAGNIPEKCQSYFNQQIHPFLNEQIKYIGPVNDQQKNELLGNALAFLFPIEWDEPFGIVMIEAIACGTPVIAFPKGAVPEIVKDGITGYQVQSTDEAIEKISQIHLLDRKRTRQEALQRFDSKIIAQQYLELYQRHIEKIKK